MPALFGPALAICPRVRDSTIDYLVDAGPLIGFLDVDDEWHEWSRLTLALLNGPLATTETELAEACHRLRRTRPALEALPVFIAQGQLRLIPVFSDHPARVGERLAKYPQMDAGDATLVVLSEQIPDARLITLDEDFRHYRRNRHQPIPVVMPRRN
jgi:predicted nucleic acid-binding protein